MSDQIRFFLRAERNFRGGVALELHYECPKRGCEQACGLVDATIRNLHAEELAAFEASAKEKYLDLVREAVEDLKVREAAERASAPEDAPRKFEVIEDLDAYLRRLERIVPEVKEALEIQPELSPPAAVNAPVSQPPPDPEPVLVAETPTSGAVGGILREGPDGPVEAVVKTESTGDPLE